MKRQSLETLPFFVQPLLWPDGLTTGKVERFLIPIFLPLFFYISVRVFRVGSTISPRGLTIEKNAASLTDFWGQVPARNSKSQKAKQNSKKTKHGEHSKKPRRDYNTGASVVLTKSYKTRDVY